MASIRKRVRKDGTASWQVMWREPDGTQSGITFFTEPEAKNLQRALKANGGNYAVAQKAIVPDSDTHTVAEVAQRHIDMLIRPTSQTLHMYQGYRDRHIMDSIGGVPVEELNRAQLAAWVRGLMAKPTTPGRTMAPKTVRNIFGFLSSVMGTAVQLGYISANPCKGIDMPNTHPVDDDSMFLTYKEFQTLRNGMDAHYRTFITFLVTTGARYGEATAVTVADLNLTKPPASVRINKAWKSDGRGHFMVGQPKTKTSRRTVSLPTGLIPLLEPLVEGKPSDALVFTDAKGQRMSHIVFYRTYWKQAVANAQAADPTFTKNPKPHGLRHTHASWLIQEGVDMFKIARRLGHVNTGMLDQVYGHLMPDAQVESASAIGRAMLGDGLPELEALKEDPEES